jgi:hypothetical protein
MRPAISHRSPWRLVAATMVVALAAACTSTPVATPKPTATPTPAATVAATATPSTSPMASASPVAVVPSATPAGTLVPQSSTDNTKPVSAFGQNTIGSRTASAGILTTMRVHALGSYHHWEIYTTGAGANGDHVWATVPNTAALPSQICVYWTVKISGLVLGTPATSGSWYPKLATGSASHHSCASNSRRVNVYAGSRALFNYSYYSPPTYITSEKVYVHAVVTWGSSQVIFPTQSESENPFN